MKTKFELKGKLWIYSGAGAWHFLTIEKDVASEIDFFYKDKKRGWGSLPVLVRIGETEFKTSIFPDKKSGGYLLPIKALVRKNEDVSVGDLVEFEINILA